MKTQILNILLIVFIYYTVAFLVNLMPKSEGVSVYFVAVDQGDSAVITSTVGKETETVVVDGGPNFEIDYFLHTLSGAPYPNCHVNKIYLSHAHDDHLIGLNRLLDRCSIKSLTFNDVSAVGNGAAVFTAVSPQFLEFKQKYQPLVQNSNAEETLGAGAHNVDFNSIDAKINVLWSPSTAINSDKIIDSDLNSTSSVLLFNYKNYQILFTGDATTSILDAVVSENGYMLNKADIDSDTVVVGVNANTIVSANARDNIVRSVRFLKVSHHGSATGYSENLMNVFKPNYCVISVGKDNKYRLPNKNVILRMQQHGCTVLRTDELGTINFKLD